MTRGWVATLRVISLAVAVLMCPLAVAPGSSQTRDILSEYAVSSWSARNGLPSNGVWALAQDEAGYLWMATDVGLARFDGVRFVSGENLGLEGLPRVQAFSLTIGTNGALWIGYARSGGIARILNRSVQTYDTRDGLGAGTVNALLEDASGAVLAGTDDGLYEFAGERWQHVDLAHGATLQVLGISPAPDGGVLVATTDGVWQRHPEARWEHVLDTGFTASATRDATGTLWTTDVRAGFRRDEPSGAPLVQRDRGNGHRLRLDRQGNLWVGTLGQGLWRVRQTPEGQLDIDRLPSADPVYSIIEDRQGSIWVGTVFGLTQLTPRQLRPVHELPLMRALAATSDGRLWAAAPGELIEMDSAGEGEPAVIRRRIPAEGLQTLHADASGRLWGTTGDGLLRLDGTTLRAVRWRSPEPLSNISAVTTDRRGLLWFHDSRQGLHRYDPISDDLIQIAPPVDAARSPSLHGDRAGRVWLATATGRVGIVEPAGVRWLLTPNENIRGGLSLHEDSTGRIWGIGDGTLARFEERNVMMLHAPRLPWRRALSAVIDGTDQLWVGSETGLLRLSLADFDEVVADATRELRQTGSEPTDRILGLTAPMARPNAARTSDGRLWFVTDSGLSTIDPSRLPRSGPAPSVQIETLWVDGQASPAEPGRRLEPGPGRVAVDYALVDLMSPSKARFRYRLEGLESAWTMAGVGRQAVYTNIPPGDYLFRVQATDGEGVWAEPGSTLAFGVQPFFFETGWFLGLAIASVVLMGYAVWHIRGRAIERRAALVMNERMRLSREIHDTLLQGLAGVALQFDAISRQADPSLRPRLERLRDFVEDSLGDARRSIWNLRSEDHRSTLDGALRAAIERAAALAGLDFQFLVSGDPRPIDPQVEHHVFRIAQEAVTNVARHAQASHLRVALHFTSGRLELEVSDNGRGMEPEVHSLEDSPRFGVRGMRERAEQLGGTLHLRRGPSGGTVVQATIPITPSRGARG